MKQAILFASFGVVNAAARTACIDAAAAQIAKAFPAYEVRQAYTSVFIKKKLAEQGIQVDSLPEALERLQAEGFSHVIIQPGYLTAGEEYEKKVLQVAAKYQDSFAKLMISRPIMERPEDEVLYGGAAGGGQGSVRHHDLRPDTPRTGHQGSF